MELGHEALKGDCQINIRGVSTETYRAAKIGAAHAGVTFREYVIDALDRYNNYKLNIKPKRKVKP